MTVAAAACACDLAVPREDHAWAGGRGDAGGARDRHPGSGPPPTSAPLRPPLAPAVGGSPGAARRDGAGTKARNAGAVEAAFADALGVRLGGPVRYAWGVADRAFIGADDSPEISDIGRVVSLSRTLGLTSAGLAVSLRLLPRMTDVDLSFHGDAEAVPGLVDCATNVRLAIGSA